MESSILVEETCTITFEHMDGRKITAKMFMDVRDNRIKGSLCLHGVSIEDHGNGIHSILCNLMIEPLGIFPHPDYVELMQKPKG